MRRILPLFAAASLVALAACNKPAPHGGPSPTPPAAAAPDSASAAKAAADAAPEDIAAPAAQADQATGARSSQPVTPPTPSMPMLAMAYRLGLVLPSDQVRPILESHQEACERAGPMQCQVLGAELKSEGHDNESATLSLRATPAWMRAFRGRAEADAKDAGGRIRDAATTGEDLSRPIGDGEAAERALAAEKARLKELLDRRTRHLDDSLAVEQEITRVQGDIDAQDSALGAMRDRVAMQTLTVDYTSAGMAFDGDGAPVARATHDFGRHMAAVFAVLINLASFLAPFVILGAPIVWLIRGRVKTAKTAAPPKAEAPAG